MGVAGATVIAYWFEKVAIVIYLKQKHNIGFNDYSDKKWYIGYVSILLITCFLKYSFL
jgi:Na+-driven multidrug efflux pump